MASDLAVQQAIQRYISERPSIQHGELEVQVSKGVVTLTMNLSLDACWRFAGMPAKYYRDWLKVAAEEAYHFTLLSDHLETLRYPYGDVPAHNGLWDMVAKAKGDVLARMALVPRTLEARPGCIAADEGELGAGGRPRDCSDHRHHFAR